MPQLTRISAQPDSRRRWLRGAVSTRGEPLPATCRSPPPPPLVALASCPPVRQYTTRAPAPRRPGRPTPPCPSAAWAPPRARAAALRPCRPTRPRTAAPPPPSAPPTSTCATPCCRALTWSTSSCASSSTAAAPPVTRSATCRRYGSDVSPDSTFQRTSSNHSFKERTRPPLFVPVPSSSPHHLVEVGVLCWRPV